MYKEPAWPFPCLTNRTGRGKLTKVSAGKVGGACVLLLSFCPRLYHWVSPCQILQPYLIFIFIVGHKFSVQNNLEKGPSRDHFWFKRRVLHGFLHTSFHQLWSTMINKLRNKSRPLLQFLPKPNFSHRSKQSCEKKLWGQTVNSLEKERESTGERAHSPLYAGAGRGCGPGPARGASEYTSDRHLFAVRGYSQTWAQRERKKRFQAAQRVIRKRLTRIPTEKREPIFTARQLCARQLLLSVASPGCQQESRKNQGLEPGCPSQTNNFPGEKTPEAWDFINEDSPHF